MHPQPSRPPRCAVHGWSFLLPPAAAYRNARLVCKTINTTNVGNKIEQLLIIISSFPRRREARIIGTFYAFLIVLEHSVQKYKKLIRSRFQDFYAYINTLRTIRDRTIITSHFTSPRPFITPMHPLAHLIHRCIPPGGVAKVQNMSGIRNHFQHDKGQAHDTK